MHAASCHFTANIYFGAAVNGSESLKPGEGRETLYAWTAYLRNIEEGGQVLVLQELAEE